MLSHKKTAATRELLKITKMDRIPKSFRSRLKLCNELAPRFYTEQVVAELRAITKACSGQYLTRNRLAHGEWLILESWHKNKPPQVVCQLRRFGTGGPEKPFTVKQIENLTRRAGYPGKRMA